MSVFRFFVPLSLLSLLPLTTEAQGPNFLFHVCSNPPTSPENSTYYSNLNILLSNFSSKANDSKFFSGKSGQDPNTVYGFFSCAGDLSQATCQDCVTFATKDVTEKCPVEQEAVIWYSECLLMFSNVSFSSNNQNTSETPALTWNLRNVTGNTTRFDETVMMAMKDLKDQAAPSPERSATSEVNNATDPFTNLYSIVQCLPQLSSAECDECLQGAIAKFPSCCSGKTGGRVLTSRCYARYELYPFFNRSESPGEAGVPTSTIIDPAADKPTSRWIQIVGGVTAVVTVAVAGFLAFKAWRMRKNRRKNIPLPSFGAVNQEFQDENVEFPSIQLDIINAATQHFSEENKIGKGGFGTVYKGVLADGKEIAVKRLSETSRQGIIEFKNEIVLIARLQHRNLVRLLGCCLESNEKLLVYEYMPNRSLDVFLFDAKLGVQLDWQKRFNIISGIARGILYLHEDSRLRIIHRDLKVSNILLDSEMNPKISDFGLARIFGGNQNEASTKRHVGTYGYMAPEYAMEGLFSVKSDVFSFGVLLLEIISGKKNNGFYICERYKSLLTSAWELWSEGRGMELIDPVLVQAYVESEVLKCIHIGLLCVQNDRAHRPTMSSVYRMLGSESIALPKPTEPAFFVGRVITEQDLPSDNIMCSTNELTLSNVEPR